MCLSVCVSECVCVSLLVCAIRESTECDAAIAAVAASAAPGVCLYVYACVHAAPGVCFNVQCSCACCSRVCVYVQYSCVCCSRGVRVFLMSICMLLQGCACMCNAHVHAAPGVCVYV